jgi:hypothetical protein
MVTASGSGNPEVVTLVLDTLGMDYRTIYTSSISVISGKIPTRPG